MGPARELRTLAAAAAVARDGNRIEVDAGEYRRDVAAWPQNGLSFVALGGRVRLIADGAASQGKAIFVISGRDVSIDGFDFEECRVPDLNGAGIRQEAGTLRVRRCRFLRNESGILTANTSLMELDVEDCEFGHQQRADSRNHHLYAGSIARLRVRRSHFHHGAGGHLIKSRASIHEIVDNRLIDGEGGRASYELEFPNGGLATVTGNVIEQSAASENPHLISFGIEGYQRGDHVIEISHNTLVNRLPGPTPWIRVAPGAVQVTIHDNLWVGTATSPTVLNLPPDSSSNHVGNNLAVSLTDLEDPGRGDYRLKRNSPAWKGLSNDSGSRAPGAGLAATI